MKCKNENAGLENMYTIKYIANFLKESQIIRNVTTLVIAIADEHDILYREPRYLCEH